MENWETFHNIVCPVQHFLTDLNTSISKAVMGKYQYRQGFAVPCWLLHTGHWRYR